MSGFKEKLEGVFCQETGSISDFSSGFFSAFFVQCQESDNISGRSDDDIYHVSEDRGRLEDKFECQVRTFASVFFEEDEHALQHHHAYM